MRNYISCLSFFLLLNSSIFAQFSGQNLLEYQFGKLPNESAKEFSTVYNRSLLNYNIGNFRSGATIEQFYSPIGSRNYTKFSQYRVQYFSEPIEIKLGHLYETIGRGLLLRSFEIPGAILEDKSYRSRQYFHRDILGASAKFSYKNFSTKIIYGAPTVNVLPLTFTEKERRTDRIGAIQAEYNIGSQNIGLAIMNLENATQNDWYANINTSGSAFSFLNYYGELAKMTNNNSLSDFSSKSAFALYLNLNFSFDGVGLSAEYKNYNNFVIGSGFNEPPALIKEHSYKSLNRSTHVLQPQNEKGIQIEAYKYFANQTVLTLNYTQAINQFKRKYVFHEFFTEYNFFLSEIHDIKVFADLAQDPFNLETDRFSSGLVADWKLNADYSLNTTFEFQALKRQTSKIENQVASLAILIKSKTSFYLIAEKSNDPAIIEMGTKYWFGGGFKYKIKQNHAIQLFAGERRGGPACNSGVCYEVLDFKGIELRISSRF